MKPRTLTAIVAVLAVAAAACGGGGNGNDDPGNDNGNGGTGNAADNLAEACDGIADYASFDGGIGSDAGGGDGTFTTVISRLDATVPPNPFAPDTNSHASYNSMQLAWPKNTLTDPNQFYPGLAESWELTEDQSELTVNLQPDAKWSDGVDVTSDDVALSVQIAYTRGSGAFVLTPGAAGTARDVEIVDDKTIRFLQDTESPSNTFVLGIFSGMPIVPAHVYGDLIPDDFDEILEVAQGDDSAAEDAREQIAALAEDVVAFDPGEDVSAGPFVLDRINPSQALLVKNEHFYAADNVAPERVVVLNYTGNEQIWDYLIAGQLDAAPFVAAGQDVTNQIGQVESNILSRSYSPVAATLAFNQSYEPYDDVRVRRALAYLIDREQMTRIASPAGGIASLTTSGLHQEAACEWLGESMSDLEPYALDHDRARAELEDAGFTEENGTWHTPDGEPWNITIQVVEGFSDWISAGQNIATQLQEFGISAETVSSPDFGIYQEEMAEGEYPLGFWLIGTSPSAHTAFQRIYGLPYGYEVLAGTLGYEAPGEGSRNWIGGPQTVELDGAGELEPGELAHELQTADPERETEIVQQLAQVTNAELPVIQMWDYVNTRYFNDTRFEGFPTDDEALRLSPGVWMAEGWITAK